MKFGRPDWDADPKAAFAKIERDEPVFLLRAQDQIAATALRFYARLLEINGARDDRQLEMARSVMRQAHAFDQWPKHKMPDMPWDDPAGPAPEAVAAPEEDF